MQVLTDLKRCLQQYAVFAQDEILILTVFTKIVARRGTGPRPTNRQHVSRHDEDRPSPYEQTARFKAQRGQAPALRTDSTFKARRRQAHALRN